ncbi:MAG: MFS transporter [Bacteroidota bacterium]
MTDRHKNIIKISILFVSMMTVMAGATIAPSLPEMKKAFADNANADTLVKLVLTIPGLFIAFSAIIFGWVIDRFGRIKVLVLMLMLYGLAGTSGLYLDSLFQIIVGRALLGIAVGGIMPTAVALIGDYFEGEERQKFLGIQAAIMSFSGTFFIFGGGFLADISWRYPFLIYGLSFLAIPLILIYVKEPRRTQQSETAPEDNGKIPSIAWTIYILSFLGMAIFYMMPVQIPFLIQEIDNVSNTATAISLSATMFVSGMIAMNYSKFKDRFTHYQIYGISFLLIGIGYLLITTANSYWWVYPGLLIAGAGSGLIMPNSNLCLVTLSSNENRGKVLGLLTTFIFMGQFSSPLMFQPIINLSSIKGGFLYLSIVLIIVAIISLIRNRRLVKAS